MPIFCVSPRRGRCCIHRQEQDELSATPSTSTASKAKSSLPENLAAFDNDAANGERLDPDNAYFPLIRAAGLYEARRDAEAIAAIHRAGQKTRYEDYANSEFRPWTGSSRWRTGSGEPLRVRLWRQAFFFRNMLNCAASLAWATVSAVHAELNGNAEEGFAIRHDIMRAGALMRVQGHSLICNLVGIAITAIPTARPGGAAPAEKYTDNLTEQEKTQKFKDKREKYFAYLHSIGHEDEAHWAEAEMQAGAKAKEITRKITDSDTGPFSMGALRMVCIWWAANLLTLTNAIGLLILGAAAAFAAAVSPGKRLKLWRGVFGLAVAGVFALWLMNVNRGVTDWVAAPFQMVQAVSNLENQGANYQSMEAAARIVALVLALAFPILMVVVIGIVSLTSKVPFCTGLGRGLRGLVLPVACVLFLLYSLLLVGTARHEATMSASLDSMVAHEGTLLASETGQEWPGPTR